VDLDILLPFHRVDNYLEEALDSIHESKSVSFNLIAIDDRPDQSKDISSFFKKFKSHTILSTGGGRGYGKALQVGSLALDAPHTALFNSDDLIHPSRFKLQIEKLIDSELSITALKRVKFDGAHSSSLSGVMRSNFYHPIFLLFGAYGANASWCMRKEWWLQNAFFDDLDCLDWRIALSAFPSTKISFISSPLYLYRKHSTQITADRERYRHRLFPVYEKWVQLAKSYSLEANSKPLFDAVATPWLPGEGLPSSEMIEWTNHVMKFGNHFEPTLQIDLRKIITRRYLFASRNSNHSMFSRVAYAKKGLPEFLPLLRDAVY